MTGIQIILLTGLILIGSYYLIKVRKYFVDLLLLIVLSVTAVFFIIYPDFTNQIAHGIGVGRGADLVFYIAILIFWFLLLKLYERIRKLESIVTKLVRNDALASAAKHGPAINESPINDTSQ